MIADDAMEKISRENLADFATLKTSTRTTMVYTNVFFDRQKLFKNIKITTVDVPLTKKQKNVDKRKITAPYGTIISVHTQNMIRGVDMRKKNKIYCTICAPTKLNTITGKEEYIYTITEYLITNKQACKENIDFKQYPDDTKHIRYYCSGCERSYIPSEVKKINHFLNEVTIVLSIGRTPLINVMLFKDNLKMAGCKEETDAAESILIFFQDHFNKIPNSYRLKDGEVCPKFVFEDVMRNVDFRLGFPINRKALNSLMNSPKYSDIVHMSLYETTGNTNVNIKINTKPSLMKYDCLVIPKNYPPYYIKIKTNKYKTKKKKQKKSYDTLIAFSSSEVILTGKDPINMRRSYEFFIKLAFKHRKKIEEKINNVKKEDWIDIIDNLAD